MGLVDFSLINILLLSLANGNWMMENPILTDIINKFNKFWNNLGNKTNLLLIILFE